MFKKSTPLLLGISLILGLAVLSKAAEKTRPSSHSKPAEQGEGARVHKTPPGEPDWQLAIAAYTFHERTLFETIEKTHECGVGALEGFGWQKISDKHGNMVLDANMPKPAIRQLKAKLAENKVKLVGYYVKTLGKDEKADRSLFEFCKKLGITYVVSEPDRKDFPAIDKLAQEYKIKVAIHNHPRKKKDVVYANWHPDSVMRMLDESSEWMGCCADTGHWVRSRLDAVKCVSKCNGRLVSLHLKDVHEQGSEGSDVPYGKGIIPMKDLLAEVKRQGGPITFSIEYEGKSEDKTKEVVECVKWFEKTKQELGVK